MGWRADVENMQLLWIEYPPLFVKQMRRHRQEK